MKRHLSLLLCGFTLAGVACAQDKLDVSVAYPAPMTVQVTGPDEVVSIARKGLEGMPFGGCTYSIDWGDGDLDPKVDRQKDAPYCTSDLTHRYTASGKYVITVGRYDIGPADGPENEREGKITVDIR